MEESCKHGTKRKVEARLETGRDVQQTFDMLKTGVRKQRRTHTRQTVRTRRKKPVVDTSDSDDCNYPEKKAEKAAARKRAAALRRASSNAAKRGPVSKRRKKKKKSKKGRGQIKAVPGILTRGVSAKNQRENLLRDPDGTRVAAPDQRADSTATIDGVALRDYEVTPEVRIRRQQAERRKNRTIIPRAKIMTGEIVAIQSTVDKDYIRDRADRGKPVQVVPPELEGLPEAPLPENATGVTLEDDQELQSKVRYRPLPPKTGVVFAEASYSVAELARKWDAHKKAGTEGVIAVASPMRDLLYRFANAPGRTPKEIVSNLAESVNDAVDADLRHIHQSQKPAEEPLPDDTLIRQAKRDEELDQIDKFYHVTLGGPTVRNLVQTTERARQEALDSGKGFRYREASASRGGDSTKCGPKERVVRKLLEYSKDLEAGFMWRAKTGRDPRTLAASDLGEKFTLEWAASRYMRAPIAGTTNANA